MSLVTQLVLLGVFAAAGWGLGEMLVGGNWIARISGAAGGLMAGFAVRDLIREKLSFLEDDSPREPPDEGSDPPSSP